MNVLRAVDDELSDPGAEPVVALAGALYQTSL